MKVDKPRIKKSSSRGKIPYGRQRYPLDANHSSPTGVGIAPAAYAHAARRHREDLARRQNGTRLARFFSRVYQKVAGGGSPERVEPPPLSPGDVIRDLPFFTQDSEVQFFSTHPSLLEEVFGLSHGQPLRFRAGMWEGKSAVVVGARGAELWVVLEGETYARRIAIPHPASDPARARHLQHHPHPDEADDAAQNDTNPSEGEDDGGEGSSSPARSVLARLTRYYGMELVDSAPAVVSPTEGAEGGARRAPLFSPATVFSAAVMAEVEREVRRLYTAEQREFLQRAPDLFVALEDLDRELPEFLPTIAESTEREGEEEGEGWDSDFDELRAGNRDSQGASTASMYHLATGGVRGASRFPPALVLLSPRVLVPSGTVGWAGEGTVFVNAGGVHHAQASISASIAV